MKDFDSQLLDYPKRHESDFVYEQLHHHLIECLELLEKWDEHRYAELIDLIQIAKVYLHNNLSEEEKDELVQKRYDKFMSKLHLDSPK